MKIVITEEQHSKLNDSIIEWFEKNLTPYEGWLSKKEYKSEMNLNSGELFLFLEEGEGYANDEEHIWYSICDNDNLSEPLPEGHCPVVTLPRPKYDALNAYFGDIWKPLFKTWFQSKTGLPVIQVDTMG